MAGFAETVGSWSTATEAQMMRVFRHAVILLAREMARSRDDGGATPKLTGNLIRSLLARIGEMPRQGNAEERFSGASVGLVVAQALAGDSVYLGFQANYARRRNFGFVGEDALGRNINEPGAHFVERAAAMWPQLVRQAIEEVKGGVGV